MNYICRSFFRNQIQSTVGETADTKNQVLTLKSLTSLHPVAMVSHIVLRGFLFTGMREAKSTLLMSDTHYKVGYHPSATATQRRKPYDDGHVSMSSSSLQVQARYDDLNCSTTMGGSTKQTLSRRAGDNFK